MGQKVHPTIFRLGVIQDWTSRWFNIAKYKHFLKEDITIRKFFDGKLSRDAAIQKIEIERTVNLINIFVNTARPGILIGRGGSGIENIKKKIESIIFNLRKSVKDFKMPVIKIEIREIRNPEAYASLLAYEAASDLERRLPFRRILKKIIEKAMENKSIKGVKISLSGRLNGSEIARTEWLSKGRIPLHTLRADIDYFQTGAYTTYGVIGVKVWLYKGEIFNNKKTEASDKNISNQ
ncbi:MAG: 30S ribosomal protein S3 [Patescibacteria group bacterium]